MAQMVNKLPAMRETCVQSLGWEDLLENGIASQSSILAWRIPRREEPDGRQSMRSQRVGYDWATNTFTFIAHHRKKKRQQSNSEKPNTWSKHNYLVLKTYLKIMEGILNILLKSHRKFWLKNWPIFPLLYQTHGYFEQTLPLKMTI